MCECARWARDFHEVQKGFHPSQHHPNCPHYKLLQFKKIEYDGSYFIDTPSNAEAYLNESEENYIVSDIYVTQDQFDKLEEFQGF